MTVPAGMNDAPTCECGCGQAVARYTRNRVDRGWIKGAPMRFVYGHNRRRPLADRFWEKVDKSGDCWEWQAATRTGYGLFHPAPGRSVGAHRIAWELLRGPIPEGLHIDHLCRNPLCVNPDHLEPVTCRENLLRGEGASARNARKTHCKRGHELAGDNLRIRVGGGRDCRACDRLRKAAA